MNFNISAKFLHKYIPLARELLNKTDEKYSAIYFNNDICASYDMERSLQFKMPVNVNGIAAISGQILADIIRAGGNSGDWEFSLENEKIFMKKDKANTRINLMNLEVPSQISDDSKKCCNIDPKKLKNAIKAVIFALSTSDQKPILKGISLKFFDNKCELVATDGYRLAYYVINIDSGFDSDLPIQFVISQKTMNLLTHLLDITQINMEISYNDKKVCFKGIGEYEVGWELKSSVLEGSFPKYDSFFNREYENKFECEADEFYKSVQQVGVIAKENQIIVLDFEKTQVQLKSAKIDVGEFNSSVDGVLIGDKEYTINFKFAFLVQIIQFFGKNKLTINLQTSGPILFTSDNMPELKYILLSFNKG